METEYKNLKIITTREGSDFVWKVTKLDGCEMDEDAESAEEFQGEQDAIDDAKEFIDGWYEAE